MIEKCVDACCMSLQRSMQAKRCFDFISSIYGRALFHNRRTTSS